MHLVSAESLIDVKCICMITGIAGLSRLSGDQLSEVERAQLLRLLSSGWRTIEASNRSTESDVDAAEEFRRQEQQRAAPTDCDVLVSCVAADERHEKIRVSVAALDIFRDTRTGALTALESDKSYMAAEESCSGLVSEGDDMGCLVPLEHDHELMWLYKQLGVEVLSSMPEFVSSMLCSDLSDVAIGTVHQHLLRAHELGLLSRGHAKSAQIIANLRKLRFVQIDGAGHLTAECVDVSIPLLEQLWTSSPMGSLMPVPEQMRESPWPDVLRALGVHHDLSCPEFFLKTAYRLSHLASTQALSVDCCRSLAVDLLGQLDLHSTALAAADTNFFQELQGVSFLPFEDIVHGFQQSGSPLVRPSEVRNQLPQPGTKSIVSQ